jgi:hypothetical protein
MWSELLKEVVHAGEQVFRSSMGIVPVLHGHLCLTEGV